MCNGQGRNYYACYDGKGTGTSWATTPGQRLQYNLTAAADDGSVEEGTRAILEDCDEALLPPHSRFVAQTTSAPGEQCFFSCRFGVRPTVARAYHEAMAQHAFLYREDLVGFLPDALQQTGGGASAVLGGASVAVLRTITIPSLWGSSSSSSSSSSAAPADGTWTVVCTPMHTACFSCVLLT